MTNTHDLLHHDVEKRTAAIAALKAEMERNRARDWASPGGSFQMPQRATNWRVQRHTQEELLSKFGVAVDFPPQADFIPIADVRAVMVDRMLEFMRRKVKRPALQLMRVPAGAGKTYAAIDAVQTLDKVDGKRVLWAAHNHDMFSQIEAMPNYRRGWWFHWRGMASDYDENTKMCRYHKEQALWCHKGYQSFQLCLQLCSVCGHMQCECPYRLQTKHAKNYPLVFAMHQHLTYGVNAGSFWATVIDELPLNSFISERVIPASELNVGGSGYLADLTAKLAELAAGKEYLKGPALFILIGDILSRCYDQIDAEYELPRTPQIYAPDDVEKLPYAYALEFLERASAEWHAWQAGWLAWESKVGIDDRGLWMLQRSSPWAELPSRIVALDATASPDIYAQIFPETDIEVYAPAIERRGRIYQIANRLNGKGTMTDDNSAAANEALEIVKSLVSERGYQNVGVVTHKDTRGPFEIEFGEARVFHFYAARGVNDLEEADAVFVIGTPSPNNNALLKQAVALSDSINPLAEYKDGLPVMPWHAAQRAYRETTKTRAEMKDTIPHRPVAGFWKHPILRVLHEQYRNAEIVQAIYRARPLTNDCDVWFLGSVPLDAIAIDRVYGLPGEALNSPEGISWQNWLALQPWLEVRLAQGETITVEMLAKVSGKSPAYVRNSKWLQAILEFDARWEPVAIMGKRGRPRQDIKPV